jgi:1-deoxy-D-xylulose-5-phosphate synthase
MVKEAEAHPQLVAITAAMAGPTGLIPFEARFPERFFDVGIAEQHAVTGAAGMAMGGLRPVVAIYSTFLNRAWDQVVYDVALHRLPVVFALDRAGITGDNGPSHHGVYDLALLAKVPGMRVLAPSSAQELQVMLHDAIDLMEEGPVAIRYPNGAAPQVAEHEVGVGLRGRKVRAGDGSVCLLAIGRLVVPAIKAAATLEAQGIEVTVWDVRCCAPLDEEMIADAAAHAAVVTCEDGVREGGIGMIIADQVRALAPTVGVTTLGVPTRFVPQGKVNHILGALGLDADGLTAAVRAAAGR